jgi:DnaJ-class molecular chaperone
MVKLVTVLETQACRSCRRTGINPAGSSCKACDGTGKIEVEVLR